MKSRMTRSTGVALLIALATAACGGAVTPPATQPTPGPQATPAPRPANEADVQFMAGMIPHHAQAVRMSALVPARSQHPQIRVLAERIAVSQKDEINLMQHWLRDHGQTVPPADATHHRMQHGGVVHDMLMPGMLTEEEFARLERARGTEFDRLFLQYMIRHHQGAVEMVDTLFKSYGAAQDETVFRFASDVFADQTTEIDRMQRLLAQLPQ